MQNSYFDRISAPLLLVYFLLMWEKRLELLLEWEFYKLLEINLMLG
jgi:hypothetical protein